MAGGGGFPVAGACETLCGDGGCQEASRARVQDPGTPWRQPWFPGPPCGGLSGLSRDDGPLPEDSSRSRLVLNTEMTAGSPAGM